MYSWVLAQLVRISWDMLRLPSPANPLCGLGSLPVYPPDGCKGNILRSSYLLAYLDSLQEDRRDKFLCIEAPEILQGFEYNGKVIARMNESLTKNYPRLGKLKAECRDFLDFVECDGIKFEYPKGLLI